MLNYFPLIDNVQEKKLVVQLSSDSQGCLGKFLFSLSLALSFPYPLPLLSFIMNLLIFKYQTVPINRISSFGRPHGPSFIPAPVPLTRSVFVSSVSLAFWHNGVPRSHFFFFAPNVGKRVFNFIITLFHAYNYCHLKKKQIYLIGV